MTLSEIAQFSNIGLLMIVFFNPVDETGVCANTALRCKAICANFAKWGLGCLMVSLTGEKGMRNFAEKHDIPAFMMAWEKKQVRKQLSLLLRLVYAFDDHLALN